MPSLVLMTFGLVRIDESNIRMIATGRGAAGAPPSRERRPPLCRGAAAAGGRDPAPPEEQLRHRPPEPQHDQGTIRI